MKTKRDKVNFLKALANGKRQLCEVDSSPRTEVYYETPLGKFSPAFGVEGGFTEEELRAKPPNTTIIVYKMCEGCDELDPQQNPWVLDDQETKQP